MPTYDYECKNCKHTFEFFQSMSDDPLTVCPECNGELRRLIGGGLGVIFKGSGFYVNDAKSATNPAGNPINNNNNSKPTGSKPATAGSGETATKPAAPSKPDSTATSSS